MRREWQHTGENRPDLKDILSLLSARSKGQNQKKLAHLICNFNMLVSNLYNKL